VAEEVESNICLLSAGNTKKQEENTLRLGCHLPVSGGFARTTALAKELGANTYQFFTRNPRGSSARNIPAAEISEARKVRLSLDIAPIAGHLPYTVNMAAPAEGSYAFARLVVAADCVRMDAVGAEFLITHPGSHAGSGKEAGLKRIVACLEENFLPQAGQINLLLETMAGQGSEIGTLEDISDIIRALGSPAKLGVCLDSCHLTGAGYDFLRPDEVSRLIDELEKTVGLSKVKAMHLNDSKYPPGSRRDRHERIGRGYLGRDGLLNLICHPELQHLPMILETPVDKYEQYGEEIALIRSWLATQ
jgi:deoxyribonuclease-4